MFANNSNGMRRRVTFMAAVLCCMATAASAEQTTGEIDVLRPTTRLRTSPRLAYTTTTSAN